jgi:hypothetical protein
MAPPLIVMAGHDEFLERSENASIGVSLARKGRGGFVSLRLCGKLFPTNPMHRRLTQKKGEAHRTSPT